MDIKFYWRKWTGKCIICGKKRENHRNCSHCLFSKYTCHMCGKIWGFASAYSMGKNKLIEVLYK